MRNRLNWAKHALLGALAGSLAAPAEALTVNPPVTLDAPAPGVTESGIISLEYGDMEATRQVSTEGGMPFLVTITKLKVFNNAISGGAYGELSLFGQTEPFSVGLFNATEIEEFAGITETTSGFTIDGLLTEEPDPERVSVSAHVEWRVPDDDSSAPPGGDGHAAVPLPAALPLLGFGLAGLGLFARRRHA